MCAARRRSAQQRVGTNQPTRRSAFLKARWLWIGCAVTLVALATVMFWPGQKLWRKSETAPAAPGIEFSGAPNRTTAEKAGEQKANAFNTLVNHATELLQQGKPAEAVEVLNQALAVNPKDEDVHYNLGMALARLGKTDEAIREYEKALDLFPDYAEAHNNLGNLLMRLNRNDEAIAHLEKAVKIMPDYAAGHNNLGTALQKAGRMDDALSHFQQAIKANPDYWQAHFNVAMSYFQMGKISEARAEFEAVLKRQPDFEPAKKALAQLESQQAGGSPGK